MPLAPNQQLYEYRIVRQLGQGGFGTVYLAHDTLLDRPVAIKELTITRQTDEQAFKRFLQEARTAGGLNHPDIVTVHALKVEGPNVYLVMEYVSGGSWRGLLEKHGKLDIEQAVKIAIDVCEGLAAVHAKDIVHRDIKPENILLTEDRRAKVSDFGIAHVPRGAGGTSLTQAGFQPGTLVYMSPEQVLGKPVDARSDVYQVGELLYEMLAGKHYIDLAEIERQARESTGNNALRMQAKVFDLLADAVCIKPAAALKRLRRDAPDELRGIIKTTLAKNPAQRPASASALSRKLAAWLDQYAAVISHVKLGIAYYAQDRLDDAISEFRVAFGLNPDCAEAHVWLGIVYHQQNRLNDAICEWQEAVRINPGYADAHNNLGNTYAKQDHLDEAIREFQVALRLNPDDAAAHNNLGNTYAKQDHLDEAIREYQVALRLNPDCAETHSNLGIAYHRQNRLDDAIRELQEVVRINPDKADAHHKLGIAYNEQDRPNDAIREFQEVIRIDPDDANVHDNLGIAYDKQGRLDDAIREYQVALRLNPGFAEAHNNLGYAYQMQHRLDDAIREYQVALRLNPDLAMAHINLGNVYYKQDRLDDSICEYQEAVRAYQEVIRINPDDADVHDNLGGVYVSLRQYADAIASFSRAIEIDPKYKYAWCYGKRAQLHRLVGLEDSAQADWQQAIALNTEQINNHPEDAGAYNGRAWELLQIGRLEEAIRDANRAIELDDKNSYSFGTRATAYALSGDWVFALRDFDRSLALESSAVDFFLRSRVRHLMGDDVGAAEDVARAKELDPYVGNDPDALVLENLSNLGRGQSQ
jgi:tetratricopeptide (TPR) repeat protein